MIEVLDNDILNLYTLVKHIYVIWKYVPMQEMFEM